MIGIAYAIPRDDPGAVRSAAGALREWDPVWDLDVPDRRARLYEPEGTLYAFCRSDGMSVLHNHREQRLASGDLLIVPEGLALDIEPEVDLLAARHLAAAPDHFRERFIQVWGFEHVGAAGGVPEPGRSLTLIPPEDVRYPLSYALHDRSEEGANGVASGLDCVLVLAMGRAPARLCVGPARESFELRPGDALLIGPGLEFTASGPGGVGIATLFGALAHEGRRRVAAERGQPAGPEFDPRAGQGTR